MDLRVPCSSLSFSLLSLNISVFMMRPLISITGPSRRSCAIFQRRKQQQQQPQQQRQQQQQQRQQQKQQQLSAKDLYRCRRCPSNLEIAKCSFWVFYDFNPSTNDKKIQ